MGPAERSHAFDVQEDEAERGDLPRELQELGNVLPRVLIVSRRHVRKNKFVDFVGEYHLDLIVKYGAVPVIVPRVHGVHNLLDSFEPIHGVLLCEGEDIDPALYDAGLGELSETELEEIRRQHSGDTTIDKDKDSIELQLARRCLERNIPYMGICRGSQILNVACGGSLYQDVEVELTSKQSIDLHHMDYSNYDGHRHEIVVVDDTPLKDWFGGRDRLSVNSYHHQGCKRLANRFRPMAYAADGLIEAFYDPDAYHPSEGGFIVGLQFHPERMRKESSRFGDGSGALSAVVEEDDGDLHNELEFDYPECPVPYQEFAKAVIAYQRKCQTAVTPIPARSPTKAPVSPASTTLPHVASGAPATLSPLDGLAPEMAQPWRQLEQSFTVARVIYEESRIVGRHSQHGANSRGAVQKLLRSRSQDKLDVGAQFLQSNLALDTQQVQRLKQMGATVRSNTLYLEHIRKENLEKEAARKGLEALGMMELQDIVDHYRRMAEMADEVLCEKRSRALARAQGDN